MYTHEQFANDVMRRFEFLETDYAMKRHAAVTEGQVSWIVYENPNAKVFVEHELGASCSLSVQNPRYIKRDPLERNEFDIEEVAVVAGRKLSKRDEPRTAAEAVAKWADLLRAVGGPVLNGDFEELQARQQKMADTIRKNQAAYDLTPLKQ